MLQGTLLSTLFCTAIAFIDYPSNLRRYAQIDETHLAGPRYHTSFAGFAANMHNYDICKKSINDCIGVGDVDTLHLFEQPIALFTYNDANISNMEFDVPVLGLHASHVKYGMSAEMPFYVHVYRNNSANTLLEYFLYIVLACALGSLLVHCVCAQVNAYLLRRRVMRTICYDETSLINSNCTICLDDFSPQEKLVKLTECKHVFHKECINTWLNTKNTCPNCQNEII